MAMTMVSAGLITAQAHVRWRHLVALYEASNMLLYLAPYLPGGMVVAIAVNSVTFYYIADTNYMNYRLL